MRSKEKVPTRNEILKNFTREFLLEEKRRCEIDRYVTDFRILIHKSPHENHNYLNRLLQDYTTMFLSHERISANKMNQEGMKYQLKSQLASRKKDSPKQRYVKSKLSDKNDSNSEHQSYLVLRAKTEDFLKKLRQYEELEQIAYEIFIQNLNTEIKTNQYEIKEVIEPNNVLKLKSTDVPIEKPHEKHHKNVYVVNSPEGHAGKHITNKTVTNSEKQNYEHLKRETEKFLANNRDYNDAEQKILSEQYKKNAYIKKYVDNLTSSEKSKKGPQTPKRGIYSKIKSMIGISTENPTKFYKNVQDNSETLVDSTKAFLRNEKKYNNFEFEAYKLFYIKNGDFQNPLIEKIKLIAYDSARDTSENGNKSKIKHLVGLKSASSNQRSSVNEEFEDFNTVKCSPTEKNEPESKMKILTTENHPNAPSKSSNEEDKRLRENTNHFLNKMKVYEDQQRYFFVIHLRKHHVNPVKEKKETILIKIKHLFFGRHEKSKEKSNYFKEITQEFLRNEQYYYGLQTQAIRIFSKDESYYQPITLRNSGKIMKNERSISLDTGKSSKVHESRQEAVKEIEKTMKKETAEKSATLKKRQKPNKTQSSLHQRSKSEDLLMFKTRSKSLDSKKSPTGHKTFSDRLKSMVGIGNRRKTRSRENISRLTDPVNYFLEHERFYYNGTPITEGKYSRSFSALENTTKDGTIKTRTKKFISTENVLYQDSNNSLAGKPPSGRRRKQERNRDDKEKRRSRTLSPAQKLVSKIRNFVQKSSPDKTKTDPKGDNHGLQEPSADIHQYVLEIPSSQRDDAIVNIEMDSPQSPISVKSIEIEEDGKKATKQMDKKKLTTSIPNEKYSMNADKSKKPKDLNNILDDPELIKNQTRIFLHDIKRYHDKDKEPNAIDKTLIFINNKSEDNNPNDKEVMKTVQLKSINKAGKNNEAVLEHTETISENYRENQNTVENSTNIDTTENSSRKIIHNSFVKETKIIQKVTTHRVHQKSTNKIISHESKTTRTKEDKPKEHIYENISISGTNQISGGSLTSNQESKKHTTTEAIPNQYHIHEVPLSLGMDLTQVEVKQSSAPTEAEKSTMKETRPKTTTSPKSSPEMNKPMAVSRPQSSVQKTGHKENEADNEKNKVGGPSKTTVGQNIELLRQYPSKLSGDKGKNQEKHKESSEMYTAVKIGGENFNPTTTRKSQPEMMKPVVLSEEEQMRLNKRNTDIFLKEHQDYHNKQRNEDNLFLKKVAEPENLIWLSSRPTKKTEYTITEVKNSIPSQMRNRKLPTDDLSCIKKQTYEFLEQHQYLIHKEEVDFTKRIDPPNVDKEKIIVETTEQQTSAPMKIKKSPKKEEKSKKNTFSKLRSFVSGSSKKQAEDESNALLRKQTSEFLDDMRKHHDKHKEVSDKFKVVWLSQQNLKPTISQKSKSDVVKPIVLTEQQKEEMRLLRQNTDIFLKDHQDYHNKQRNEDNVFFENMGKPENMIWLSSRPTKKKENIITKVKNLMSPQQPKKTIPPSETINNKMIREQSDEFLKKHQYLIHREEVDFTKKIVPFDVEKQKITVETTEQQTSAPKRIEKSPEKEEKSKKNTFSKLRSFVSGSSKKQAEDESTALLRKQTSDFLDDIRKHHDFRKESMDEYNVVWLSDQNIKSTKSPSSKSEPTKPISQNTDIPFRDHQEGPNKQINKNTTPSMAESPCDEEADSFNNLKSADNEHPSQPRKNIISKIKDVISPNKSDQTAIFYYDIDCETKEGGHLKEKPIQSSNSEELLQVEPPEFQEGNPLSADLNPAPRLKKKVTFSYTDHPETLSIVEHQKDPSDTCHHIETPSVPEVSIEAGKPRAAPRKQVAKKVKAIYIDSAEIFKQNKERFLIEETEKFLEDHKIHQKQQWSQIQNFANDKEIQGALSEPKTIQRTEENVTKSPVISKQTSSARTAFIEERRNLMLFLDDHQAHHNKERSNHINYISKQNKPYTNDLKSSTKEAKMKTKLMISLVGQSQEIIASDRKHEIENANLRKQTSEFLISQKCYNDLEGVACKKFDMKQLEKEELSKNHLKGEDSVEASSDQVASHSYSTLKKDSTFCYPGKLSVDGCPESSTKSQKPLRSSPAKKISKTENITLKETDSDINHKRGGSNEDSSTNHLITIEQTMNFLNIQRNHINSENEIWKHYLKFKPVPDPGKSHIVQKQIGKSHSKVQHRMQKPESSARKLSSQLESEKIDHEVVRHKTQLFLEDHKSFHDNLQKESSKYIPKNATQNIIEEKFQRKEGSASSKIEPSPVLGSTSFLSSNVRKPEISLEKHEENVKPAKSNDLNNVKTSSTMKEDEIKEITKNFLKDHQDYHNSERVQSDDTCKEIQKQKKSKRGVISKIKSLVTGDSHKRHSSKPTMLPSIKPQDEMGTPTKKEDIIIRELESSPATYRKHKPHSSLNEGKLKNKVDDSRKISDQNDSESSKSSDLVSQNDYLEGSSEKLTVATHGEVIGAVGREDIVSRNLYYNQVKGLPEEERKKYAFAKLKTQEFLLNQKEFSNILKSEKGQENSPESGEIIPQKENKNNSQPNVALEQELVTKKVGSEDFIKEGTGLLPSAPPLEQMDQREIENTETVIHRVVKPLSPTKTIFQEIRKREESPDRQVYIMKEGYMITKENKENVKLDKSERMENLERRRMFTSIEERSQKEEYQDHSSENPVFEEISKEGSGKASSVHSDGSPPVQTTDSTEGQDYVDRSIDSPSRSVPPQGDLEVRRYRTKKRTLADMEQGPATIVTETRIERGSNGEKKYITSCFLNKVSTPVWYTESLLLDLEEKTKKTDVKVYYDDLYEPYRWQESFNTDLTSKNTYVTEVHIPVNEQSDGIHYISLENQQLKGQDIDQEN